MEIAALNMLSVFAFIFVCIVLVFHICICTFKGGNNVPTRFHHIFTSSLELCTIFILELVEYLW